MYDHKGSREQYQVWLQMAERQLAVLDEQIGDLQAARADLEQLRRTTADELARMT
ncbi:MAG: MerR family DNA-binding protein [Paracoccus sp. (in: a-proteobacteria)]